MMSSFAYAQTAVPLVNPGFNTITLQSNGATSTSLTVGANDIAFSDYLGTPIQNSGFGVLQDTSSGTSTITFSDGSTWNGGQIAVNVPGWTGTAAGTYDTGLGFAGTGVQAPAPGDSSPTFYAFTVYGSSTTISQTTSSNILANTTYTLTFDLGWRGDVGTAPLGTGQLVGSTGPLALTSSSKPVPTQGNWAVQTYTFDTANSADASLIGTPLTVQLDGVQDNVSNYDNVSVTYTTDSSGPANSTWALSSSGSWLSSSSWTTAIPNSVDAVANFTATNTFAHNPTIYAETPVTVGTVVFNNSASSYAVTGSVGATLTFQTSTGSALVDVQAGTHELNLPLIIASNTVFQTDSSTAKLIVADPVTIGAGLRLSSTGSGTVTYQSTVTVGAGGSFALASPTYAHALTLLANSSASVATTSIANSNLLQLDSLSLAGGAGLNLGNNDLIVHGGSLSTISTAIAGGYHSGQWNGNSSTGAITSTSAAADTSHLTALGVGSITTAGTVDGTAVSAGDVLVKYTYYGDATLDGKVDGSDYSRIDNAYLADKSHPAQYTGWSNGDFNYDGVVDGSDYTLIDNAYNSQGGAIAAEIASPDAIATAQIASSAAVPEPASLGLLGIGTASLLGRRKRRYL
jgi:hypothetical protein